MDDFSKMALALTSAQLAKDTAVEEHGVGMKGAGGGRGRGGRRGGGTSRVRAGRVLVLVVLNVDAVLLQHGGVGTIAVVVVVVALGALA